MGVVEWERFGRFSSDRRSNRGPLSTKSGRGLTPTGSFSPRILLTTTQASNPEESGGPGCIWTLGPGAGMASSHGQRGRGIGAARTAAAGPGYTRRVLETAGARPHNGDRPLLEEGAVFVP
jgi:hypothetical protein